MDQDTPVNSGFGTTSGSDTGGGIGSTSSGASSSGTGSMAGGSSTGSGSSAFGSTGGPGSGMNAGTGSDVCPTCGHSAAKSAGLEQFLGRLGIDEEMITNLKTQFQNVDIDEYLNTARDYMKNGGTRATTYAKENPGKIAAGVATLALGAGLIYAAVNRDRS
ncbi:MAG TPA: hypothetical protein VFN10_12860 [Thermoanaerobaculia bacterium]|nr:hypothetical protein [Thermoanaerobaculia bacterium]